MPNALRSDDFFAKETKHFCNKAEKLAIIIAVMRSTRAQ